MKKRIVFGLFSAALMPLAASAAYPIYPVQNNAARPGMQQNIVYQPITYQQPMVMPQQMQQQQVVFMPQGQQGYQQRVAAQPNRITGTLPRVGSNATNAGRQYYQPQDYDRLVDSGLYLGLSVGYAMSVSGGMTSQYANERNAYYVPGSFQESTFRTDAVMPLQISLGAAINNDVRADFSYTRYNNIAYANVALSSDGMGGYIDTAVSGGAISSNATMMNIYYNIDSYTGPLSGGSLRPYVGVGLGISLNTISDYVIFDGQLYSECDPATQSCPGGVLTAISDIYAYHSGGTTEQLAYMLEGGVTTQMEGGLKFDFFVRYSQMGKVRSSGSIVVSQTEWLSDGAGGEQPAPYDSVFHYQNWYESGNIGTVDLGVRMRLQF
jgi:hypothetical protein